MDDFNFPRGFSVELDIELYVTVQINQTQRACDFDLYFQRHRVVNVSLFQEAHAHSSSYWAKFHVSTLFQLMAIRAVVLIGGCGKRNYAPHKKKLQRNVDVLKL